MTTDPAPAPTDPARRPLPVHRDHRRSFEENLYVNDVVRSLEFYNEIVGAEITQIHAEEEGAPISLAILRIGDFSLMLHPQEPHAAEFENTRVGVGLHLQLRVDDIDAFFQHCLDEGALLSVSGEPTDQSGEPSRFSWEGCWAKAIVMMATSSVGS